MAGGNRSVGEREGKEGDADTVFKRDSQPRLFIILMFARIFTLAWFDLAVNQA